MICPACHRPIDPRDLQRSATPGQVTAALDVLTRAVADGILPARSLSAVGAIALDLRVGQSPLGALDVI